jgi:hypothetical protein
MPPQSGGGGVAVPVVMLVALFVVSVLVAEITPIANPFPPLD